MKKFFIVICLISALVLVGCNNSENLDNNQQQENNSSYSEARKAIQNALKNSEWINENVHVKKTYFSENFSGTQELTFEILRDDLAVVQSTFYDEDEPFSQIFLVGYKDGKVQVISFCDFNDDVPASFTYAVDSDKMVLVAYSSRQGVFIRGAYQMDNLEFKEIASISYTYGDKNTDELINEFEQIEKEYDTHKIENKLM